MLFCILSSTSHAFTTVYFFIAKRTSYNAEMACARPLAMARQRGGDSIELTDSSDLTRRRRLSQPSTSTGAKPSTLANKDNPIVITSGSEDDPVPALRPTQRRKSGPGATQGRGTNRARVPPPVDAEVISLTDSEGDLGTGRPTVLDAPVSTSSGRPLRPSQGGLPPAPAPASVPESPAAPTRTQLPEQPLPQDTPSPSYGPPPDDFDDAFNNIDLDTSDGANPDQDWDGLDVGTSLPVAASSGHVDTIGTSVPEGAEDVSGSDALFESYLNMDQLEGDMDQGTGEDALPGGDGEEERAVGPGASTHERGEGEGSSGSRSTDGPNANGDVRMRSLEEGEVDPNDTAPVTSTRITETPESGEIRSQGSGGDASPPSSTAPPRVSVQTVHRNSSASASESGSASPRSTASQPLALTRTLVMPDISLYRGVRFKRPPPEAGENSFFSRALRKAPMSVEEKNASGTPVEAVLSVGEVQSQDGDANMQDDTVAKGVVSAPSLSPQQPTETTLVPDASTLAPSTTVNDGLPASTQPAPSSIRATPSEFFPATQPLARSSSRPFIAPPRVPLPGTPMSLVDVLNEVRRERLLKEEREQAQKRDSANPTGTFYVPDYGRFPFSRLSRHLM